VDFYERVGRSSASKTGTRRQLLARSCDVWIGTSPGIEAEACTDPSIPGFLLFSHIANRRGAMDEGGGPLPLELTPRPDARVKVWFRVTHIEPGTVPMERFAVPGDYRRVPEHITGLYDDRRPPRETATPAASTR
jgi:hypothetical protein